MIHDLERGSSRACNFAPSCAGGRLSSDITIPNVEFAFRKFRSVTVPSHMLLLLDNKFYYCFTRYTLVYCALSLFYFNILDFYLRLCYLNGSIIINCVIYSSPCLFLLYFLYLFRYGGHSTLCYGSEYYRVRIRRCDNIDWYCIREVWASAVTSLKIYLHLFHGKSWH